MKATNKDITLINGVYKSVLAFIAWYQGNENKSTAK